MATCNGCGDDINRENLRDGLCGFCFGKAQEKLGSPEITNILLTTEVASSLVIDKRLGIIAAECVFGVNVFRDMLASVRDLVGGRSAGTQNVLKDARTQALNELKKEAVAVGANAVVAVDLKYSEFSGGSKSMLIVVATGTAVIIAEQG